MSDKIKCGNCGELFEKEHHMDNICRKCAGPDWSGKCENCGESPIAPVTGMCGPCTFGEAETAGGNW